MRPRVSNGKRINHPLLKVKCDDPKQSTYWIKFAILVAGQYVGRCTLDNEELVSAAMEGVCEAMPKLDLDRNPLAFVREKVHKAISMAIEYASMIRVPHTSEDRDETLVRPAQVEMSDVASPEGEIMELLEEILACCSSELEREIILGRARGLSDRELGKLHYFSHQTIWVMRKEVEERYVERTMG